MSEEEYKIGQTSTCHCNNEIMWIGEYWQHVVTQRRHPAHPKVGATIHNPVVVIPPNYIQINRGNNE